MHSFLRVSLLGLGSVCLVVVALARGPNRDLHLTRGFPSSLSPDRLDRNISSITRWPQWFHSLAEVIQVDPQSPHLPIAATPLEKGTYLKLKMDPKKGDWKRFEILARVEEYLPGKTLALKILDDSSGRLNRLFNDIVWKIEVTPRENGSQVLGYVQAHTIHWRSRLFGQLAEKVLMNQIFYPNLIQLVELRQPFSMDLSPQLGPPTGSM